MKFATDQFYFKTAEEMARVFRELPTRSAAPWIIAARCNVKIERISERAPRIQGSRGPHSGSYFEKVAREGFAQRVPFLERLSQQGALRHPLAEYERRLSSEIEMIRRCTMRATS